jgi:hypothetical protein
MSGGPFDSLTPVNMYEVQNIVISVQVIPERKRSFITDERYTPSCSSRRELFS